MQIFVTNVTPEPLAVNVLPGMTASDLALHIENVTFCPADQFYLSHNSTALQGTLSLAEDDVVECLVQADAGMRAKWRKKRMRRLRRKRRKMRQRAR